MGNTRKLSAASAPAVGRSVPDHRQWSLPPGHIEAGRYMIVREIGRGGMGVVYEADDSALDRPVALKLLSADLVDDEAAVRRFHREAMAVGRVNHPNICDVRDRGQTDDGVPFIVMELLEGESLDDLLRRVGPLDVEDVVDLLCTVLSALQAAHRKGVVHRDLKPANIFLARGPDGERVPKLVDFGIAKRVGVVDGTKITQTGTILGTPQYMSPEQARGVEDVGPSADLWAVAVIAYECATGQMPFDGANALEILHKICDDAPTPLRRLQPAIPPAFEAVILRGLNKDPATRFPDAAAFSTALLGAIEGADDVGAGVALGAGQDPSSSAPPRADEFGTAPTVLARSTPAQGTVPARPAVESALPPTTLVDSGAVPATTVVPASPGPKRVELPDVPPVEERTFRISLRTLAIIGGVVVLLILALSINSCLTALRDRPRPWGERMPSAPPFHPEPVEPAVPQPPLLTPPPTYDPGPGPLSNPRRRRPADSTGDRSGPLVTVRIVGVPAGALITYDNQIVTGRTIRGRLGDRGMLRVQAVGYPPVEQLLTLEVGKVVDLSDEFQGRP